MMQMIGMIMLFILPKTQNYMFLLWLYQQETIKNYQNFLVKDFKDQFSGYEYKTKSENRNTTNEYR